MITLNISKYNNVSIISLKATNSKYDFQWDVTCLHISQDTFFFGIVNCLSTKINIKCRLIFQLFKTEQ